jgi:hypothetical protein
MMALIGYATHDSYWQESGFLLGSLLLPHLCCHVGNAELSRSLFQLLGLFW